MSASEESRMSGKALPVVVLVVVGLALAAWFGEAQGWFGTRSVELSDVIRVTFRPVDANSGQRLGDVRVNCFMRGKEEACSLVRDGREMLVTIAVGVTRIEERSLLSRFDSHIVGGQEVELNLMFIAPDYDRLVKTWRLDDLAALQGEEQRVELLPMPPSSGPEPVYYGPDGTPLPSSLHPESTVPDGAP
jgi:hypothetical protein